MPDMEYYENRIKYLQECLNEEGNNEQINPDSLRRFYEIIAYIPKRLKVNVTLTPDGDVYISAIC